MKTLMTIFAALLISQSVWAAEVMDEAEIERQIEQAREQIDAAAQKLRELSLMQYEHTGGEKRAMLGILLGAHKADDGVVIDGVTPLSGAAEAGLQGGDKIIVIGDVDLAEADYPNQALSKYMAEVSPGESVPLTFLRDGKRMQATVVTKERAALAHARRAMLGVLIGDHTEGGVEIVGVTPGGGAAEAGLQAGDKIVEIGDVALGDESRPQKALSAYMKTVRPGDAVDVTFLRDGTELSAAIVTRAHGEDMGMFFDKNLDFKYDFDFDSFAPGVAVKRIIRSEALLPVDGDLARYFDVDAGVVVISPPTDSEIKAGDVVLEIGGEAVEGMEQAMTLLDDLTDGTPVKVKRRGRERTVTVHAGEFAAAGKTRVIKIQAPAGPNAETIVEIED